MLGCLPVCNLAVPASEPSERPGRCKIRVCAAVNHTVLTGLQLCAACASLAAEQLDQADWPHQETKCATMLSATAVQFLLVPDPLTQSCNRLQLA